MNKIKTLFETPRKAILSCICAVAVLAALGTGTAYAASAIAENSAIGTENAQNFAFADAGIDPVSAKLVRTEFEFALGQFVYEVEFTVNGNEYEYWVKSSDGTILKKEIEIKQADGSSVTATAKITQDQAKEAALKDAGLAAAAVTFTKEELDVENGVTVYDIAFHTADTQYEYEINAATGAVYSKSREVVTAQTKPTESHPGGQQQPAPPQNDPSNGLIGLDAAKEKALADAGVSASLATFTKQKLDYDDGLQVYDVTFYTSTHEYEYEINAMTGAIHEKSVEIVRTPQNPGDGHTQGGNQGNSGAYIGMDKAKSIAVAKAGFSVADVTFKKAKLDRDDGYIVYEIAFYKNGMEYECTIHAVTGAVLEYEYERDD